MTLKKDDSNREKIVADIFKDLANEREPAPWVRQMERSTRNAWLFAAVIVAVGGAGLLISIRYAAAGHGSYSMARVFFPYSMILGDLLGEIGIGARALALLQYPIYAIVALRAVGPRRHSRAAWGAVLAHFAAVVGAFAARTEIFP